jgi:hypothetical protein
MDVLTGYYLYRELLRILVRRDNPFGLGLS